jgi:hypothetical protein
MRMKDLRQKTKETIEILLKLQRGEKVSEKEREDAVKFAIDGLQELLAMNR